MSASVLLAVVVLYFALLLAVAWWTSRRADNDSFFIGNRNSHWALVAFGMIGTSLSGVTFISVPGSVGSGAFSYFQIMLGQVAGYAVVAFVLLPLYYRLQLASIYRYLGERLGLAAHRTGAGFFILSRTLGATARLYLVVRILQDLVLAQFGMPFWLSALLVLVMILLYTLEGGVKTIVWTDTLQTTGMLGGLVICVIFLLHALGLDLGSGWQAMRAAGLAEVFVTDPMSASHWGKQFLAGAAIAIAMTGLDQEMMQKNISVKRLADAQKNMMVMAAIMTVVVLLFLFLGGLLSLYAAQQGITAHGDRLFPAVVMEHLPAWVQLIFVVALISALFPSADGAITALTSSTCIDLIGLQQRQDWDEARKRRVRKTVHLGYAVLFLLLTLGFRWLDDPSMVNLILKLAGYTYGPLLGLFAFGILTRRRLRAGVLPWIALAAPALCWVVDAHQATFFGDYRMGLELLLVNAALTFGGLWAGSRPPAAYPQAKAA
ncbi:MAG: sodium:solute symporter [Mitsuaria chitosanitabida]|uniref:sodium:solute symporter n=1 Tax=Roseateles chitosanitabidus TaxID=65048 RepID=UPI001B107694|nr:sodium:solute symporter [Roseateles chitosanitabidus]MBO9687937.1 sodium:solute symporter [Roseateles chitosanitabidus]